MAFMRPLVNCLLLVLAWLPVLAYSQALPVPDLPFSFVTAANESQFKPFMFNNSNYTNVNNLAKFSAANDGSFLANVTKSVPVGGGRMIPVSATYAAPKSAVVGALGRFIGKVAGPLAVGVALYDLAKELGYFAHKDANGNLVVDKEHNIAAQSYRVCQVEIGMGRTYDGPDCYSGAIRAINDSGQYDYYDLKCPSGPPGYLCTWKRQSTGYDYSVQVHWGASVNTPASTTYTPASSQELIDAIANKSGWPSSSALPRAVQEAVKSGEELALEPQTLTGPAKSPGPSSVTQNSNNTKIVTTTENKYSYSPNTVTTSTVSNTTIIDNSTGDILNESNTNGSPSTEPGVDICTLYPNILSCAELDELPDVDLKTKDIPVAITPDGGWGGSSVCPAPRHVTVQGYDVPMPFDLFCKYAELIRPVLLTFAWLSAAFILVGGVKET